MEIRVFEERDEPQIIEPTDVILRLAATCVCGSDLWPYRGIDVICRRKRGQGFLLVSVVSCLCQVPFKF